MIFNKILVSDIEIQFVCIHSFNLLGRKLLLCILLALLFRVYNSTFHKNDSDSSSGDSDSSSGDSDSSSGDSDSSSGDSNNTPSPEKQNSKDKLSKEMPHIILPKPKFSETGEDKNNYIVIKKLNENKQKKISLKWLLQKIKNYFTFFNLVALYFYYIIFIKIIYNYGLLILLIGFQLLFLFFLVFLVHWLYLVRVEIKNFILDFFKNYAISIYLLYSFSALALIFKHLKIFNNSIFRNRWFLFFIFLYNAGLFNYYNLILWELWLTSAFLISTYWAKLIGIYTPIAGYLFLYYYIYINFRDFIVYMSRESYYRDAFICYFAKIFCIYFYIAFPLWTDKRYINVGRVSYFLRWLYWNWDYFKLCVYYSTLVVYKKLKMSYPLLIKWCFYLFFLFIFLLKIYEYLKKLFEKKLDNLLLIQKKKKIVNKKINKSQYSYVGFNYSFGDKVKEKLFDIIPLKYKLTKEFINFEWLSVTAFTNYFNTQILYYYNQLYVFVLKRTWVLLKYFVYTKCKESLIEFYCTLPLWLEWYAYKYLGLFLEAHIYIPIYIDFITNHITQITWGTLMNMFEDLDFFGYYALIEPIENYYYHRATRYIYQDQFWKNHRYEYSRKKIYNRKFTTKYWSIYIRFFFYRRVAAKNHVSDIWSSWWYRDSEDL